MDETLVDLIYEAAVIPERWGPALDRLAAFGGAACGSLIVAAPGPTPRQPDVQAVANAAGARLIAEFRGLETPILDTRMATGLKIGRHQWVTDLDMFAADDLAKDPLYRDFLWPRGYGWVAGTFIGIPGARNLCFSLERHRDAGPMDRDTVARLDAVRPHVGRAAILAAESAFRARRMVTLTLGALGIPGALIAADGRVIDGNDLFHAASDWAGVQAIGRYRFRWPHADALYAAGLDAMKAGVAEVSSFAVRSPDGEQRGVAHLLPLRREARDVFTGAAGILALALATSANVLPADVLQLLLGLTPAEANVARRLALGSSVGEVASETGRSIETIRSQLKALLAKSGLEDQRDLVGLIRSFQVPKGF